jgi:hypothetical protein
VPAHLPTPTLNAPEDVPPRRLSADLSELLREADGRSLTLGELEEILRGRGFALFILLLNLPFMFPIAIPGLSIPFGIVIMLLGLRIALGQKPSLPGFILRRRIQYSTLEKIINFGLKLCRRMEALVRPRMHFLQRWPGMINLIGLGIASGGLQLCLPLPPVIPLSNFLPAVSIMMLTAGMVERDGLLVLGGYFVNLFAWTYFALVSTGLITGVQELWQRWGM